MTDYSELKRLAESLALAVERAEHKPGQWAETVQSMGGICCPGEKFQIGKPWVKEEPWASFSYKRDSWLAVAAVNALPQLLALIADADQSEQDYKDVVGTIELRDIEISRLKTEIAGLKTGYEAYERVNAELKAEVEEWKGAVRFNEKCWSEERGTMIDKIQESRMRIKEMDLLFGRYILAMRSALIEEEHGKGPAAAMEWIYNSLAGPGELPPEGETDSQAYFDREIVAVDDGMLEVMAFHEGRRAALGQGEQA